MTEGNYYTYKFKKIIRLLVPASMNFLSFIVQYVNGWNDLNLDLQI
jgi:hypothetical protein